MLIREIVLEGYQADILTAVQDLLTNHMADDAKKIPTEQFQSELSKQGFVTTTDELIKAVNDSGYASSIDKDFIKPKDQKCYQLRLDMVQRLYLLQIILEVKDLKIFLIMHQKIII